MQITKKNRKHSEDFLYHLLLKPCHPRIYHSPYFRNICTFKTIFFIYTSEIRPNNERLTLLSMLFKVWSECTTCRIGNRIIMLKENNKFSSRCVTWKSYYIVYWNTIIMVYEQLYSVKYINRKNVMEMCISLVFVEWIEKLLNVDFF